MCTLSRLTSKDLMSAYNKKTWTASGCIADHKKVVSNLGKILDAYVGPNSIEPSLNEAVMVTVNSVNSCPYCEGLHGQLARMAGVDEPEALQSSESVEACRQVVDHPAITYARRFAETNGRGEGSEGAFEVLKESEGAGRASSIRALCWFLLWGSIGGNTTNAFLSRLRGKPRAGSSFLFELIFFLYYAPLFALIAVVNALLRFAPKVPAWFSASFGVLLTVIASVWIIPLGIVALLIPAKPRVLATS